jgi:hypothetical protein
MNCYYSCLWFTGMEYTNSIETFPLNAVLEENYRNFSIHSNFLVKILRFFCGPSKCSLLSNSCIFQSSVLQLHSCVIPMFFLFLCFCFLYYMGANRTLLFIVSINLYYDDDHKINYKSIKHK